jgi:hypothetical protein
MFAQNLPPKQCLSEAMPHTGKAGDRTRHGVRRMAALL